MAQNKSIQRKILREYIVPTICGFARLRFLSDGTILLLEESVTFQSEHINVLRNKFETLYEFLSRNVQRFTRDELLFKINKDLESDAENIRVPHPFLKKK
ncbi:MAG: hypothetical protein GF364_18355 [Candidatus Lokiarchaeota archaeon]|nr:hypothetical protein [Candidatus Lokiarchaeota archaeon]